MTATTPGLATMYADWQKPFFGDLDQETLDARTAQARQLAAGILGAPIGTRLGAMIINTAGWSLEKSQAAFRDLPNSGDIAALYAYLGAHDHATLTADGRGANREQFCRCDRGHDAAAWVRYEGWTAAGCTAHGYVCGTCRAITQTG